jgi:hypothetical protein
MNPSIYAAGLGSALNPAMMVSRGSEEMEGMVTRRLRGVMEIDQRGDEVGSMVRVITVGFAVPLVVSA